MNMTTERMNEIISTLKATTNKETVIDAVMDLVKESYNLGKSKKELDFFEVLAALIEAKRE